MSGLHSLISQGVSYLEPSSKSFISTRAFDSTNTAGTIFTYTTYVNASLQTIGTLVANANATATNCPVGRVVHVNGKKLLPNVNPSITKVYLGVYDPISFLNGYIDPTDSTWAIYDVTLGATYDLGTSNQDVVLGGQGAEPRFGRAVNATTTGTTTGGAAAIGAGHTGVLTIANAPTVITVTSSEIRTASVVLLTLGGATAANLRVSAITSGTSFAITSSAALAAADTIHYLIIN